MATRIIVSPDHLGTLLPDLESVQVSEEYNGIECLTSWRISDLRRLLASPTVVVFQMINFRNSRVFYRIKTKGCALALYESELKKVNADHQQSAAGTY